MSDPRIDPSRKWEKDVWYEFRFGARADEHEMGGGYLLLAMNDTLSILDARN